MLEDQRFRVENFPPKDYGEVEKSTRGSFMLEQILIELSKVIEPGGGTSGFKLDPGRFKLNFKSTRI